MKKDKKETILVLDPVSIREHETEESARQGDELAKKEIKDKDRVLSLILKSFDDQAARISEGTVERMAFEVDPDRNYSGFSSLYRNKENLTPDQILKRIAGPQGDDLVCHILQARSNHIASFGRPRTSRFSIGFDMTPMNAASLPENNEGYELQKQAIDAATEVIWNCGLEGLIEDSHPNLSQFLKIITRSGLTFGRFAVEIIWRIDPKTGEEKPHSFRPVDAGTIYRVTAYSSMDQSTRRNALKDLEKLKNRKIIDKDRFMRDEYKWLQVIRGVPKQAFSDKELVVYNLYPTADVDYNGYPLTPIDQSIHAITTHINITLHNKLYFQNGRAARGMMVFKSDSLDEGQMQKIRSQVHQTINSVTNSWKMPVLQIGEKDDFRFETIDVSGRDAEFQYLMDSNARVILSAFQMSPEELPGYSHLCLHPDTTIWTDKGITSIGCLLGDNQSVDNFKVWNGTDWVRARAFVTGSRKVCKTTTSNGMTISTSPEHRFRIVNESGDLDWVQQQDLKVGDTVLVNRNPIPGLESAIPSYRDKKLTPEMMEVLGWLSGDGSITVRKKGIRSHSKELEFYYHHDKELDIRDRHYRIMSEFGLNPKMCDRQISSIAVEREKQRCGFKSISSVRRLMKLYNTDFVGWLIDIGFTPATKGKAIPDFIHSLPEDYRSAFLRGLFSADGSKDCLNTPSLSVTDSNMRLQVKRLLLNMGIRTRVCEGTTRMDFSKQQDQFEYLKQYVKEPSRLIIKDKVEFFERIGFLQKHKQWDISVLDNKDYRWDKVARSVAVSFANNLLAINGLSGQEREEIRHTFKDPKYMWQLRSKLCRFSEKYKVAMPSWINDFYQESVVSIERTDEMIDMMDIEVFNDDHSFIAEGIVVHNSRGTNSQALSESNNEYKLIAARDVGLRPLLYDIQDFFNAHVLPLFFPQLAKTHQLEFIGLEKSDPEKESTRLTQDMQIHMTYDEIMEKVEKDKLGKELGGDFPLNPQFQALLSQYFTVGYILENFFGQKGAASDPRWNYVRDPFWLQYQSLLVQKAQMAMQQQMMVQQQQAAQMQQSMQQPGEMPAQNEDSEDGQEVSKSESIPVPMLKLAAPDADALQKAEIDKENQALVEKWHQDSMQSLQKNIKNNHSLVNRMILKRHKEINEARMKEMKEESQKALQSILETVKDK